MFDGLLSKFKKNSSKDTPKFTRDTTNEEAGKSGKALMFASISLIVLGSATIAYEYMTTSAAPMLEPSVPKTTIKPATQTKPASAPVAVSK